MRLRAFGLVASLVAFLVFCEGCGGGGGTETTKPTTESAPFVAKGKLRSEAEAKAAGKTVPAR
jgi:hypothetical protein